MRESLAQIFNETATEAHAAFPQQLENLVVLLCPSSETPVYVAPEIATQLADKSEAVKAAVAEKTTYMNVNNAAGLAYRSYALTDTFVKLIAVTQKSMDVFSSRYTRKMRNILNLDHELGHHILRYGHPYPGSRNLAESSADVYAQLRHIQRFGNHTGLAKNYGNSRARGMVLYSDKEHYTTVCIQKAMQLSKEQDISALSLQETVALAEKIAFETYIHDNVLDKIRTAFLPVQTACATQIGTPSEITEKFYQQDKKAYMLFCRKTLAVMRRHRKDADIFKAGKQFLSYPPLKKFMQKQAQRNTWWKEALVFINQSDKKPPAARNIRRQA